MNNVARIVVVNSIKPHPNADKLQIVNLFGTQIITDKNVHVGDQMIYFDSNLRLSQSYLHHNNLYRTSDLNLDKTVSGYFDANGRVKAIKLRNEFSDGVLMPLRSLDYLPDTDKSKLIPGYEFQTYSQELICEKYIAQVTIPSVGNKNKIKKKRVQSSAMFVEHLDTDQYFKHSHRIPANTLCYIMEKTHGTSGRIGNVLVETTMKRNWFKRMLMRFVGIANTYTYRYVHGTRRVVLSEADRTYQPYHDPSMREQILDKVKGLLPKGVQVYFEIYGYEPSGKWIQKGFSYGCEPGQFKVKLYRMTMNNEDGLVLDYSLQAVIDKAKELGFEAPHIFESCFYDGTPKSLEILNDKVIAYAQGCSVMDPKTIREGVIVQFINSKGDWDYLKYKSDAFKLAESSMKDAGEVDPEDVN